MLGCSPRYNIAEAYFILLRSWDNPNLQTLPTYTLSWYIAELFPIWEHLVMYTLSDYIAELLPTLERCRYLPCLTLLLKCCQY